MNIPYHIGNWGLYNIIHHLIIPKTPDQASLPEQFNNLILFPYGYGDG